MLDWAIVAPKTASIRGALSIGYIGLTRALFDHAQRFDLGVF